MALGFNNNEQRNVLNEVRLTYIKNLLATKVHEELRKLLNRPFTSLIHGIDLFINIPHEEYKHELYFDFPLILIAEHHSLAILLLGFNLLVYMLNSHRLLIG